MAKAKHNKKTQEAYDRTAKGKFRKLKQRAKRDKIYLDLTLEEYERVTLLNKCFYCADELPHRGYGLDRVDSEKGYTLSNVVPCCSRCNRIKSHDISFKEMRTISEILKIIKVNRPKK